MKISNLMNSSYTRYWNFGSRILVYEKFCNEMRKLLSVGKNVKICRSFWNLRKIDDKLKCIRIMVNISRFCKFTAFVEIYGIFRRCLKLFRYLIKISKKLIFGKKSFLTKFSTFHTNYDFWHKLPFLDNKFDFWHKLRFFDKNFDF